MCTWNKACLQEVWNKWQSSEDENPQQPVGELQVTSLALGGAHPHRVLRNRTVQLSFPSVVQKTQLLRQNQ